MKESVESRIATPDGMPLYPTTIRQSQLPACACGGKLFFNLQILPTLLSFVSLDAGDTKESIQSIVEGDEWSSVLVYTCEHACNLGYVEVLPPFYCVCFKQEHP